MRSFGLAMAVLVVMVGFGVGGMWFARHRAAEGKESIVAETKETIDKAIDKVAQPYEDLAKKTTAKADAPKVDAAKGGATPKAAPKMPSFTEEQVLFLKQKGIVLGPPGPAVFDDSKLRRD